MQEFTAAPPFVVNMAAGMLSKEINNRVDKEAKIMDVGSKVRKKFCFVINLI